MRKCSHHGDGGGLHLPVFLASVDIAAEAPNHKDMAGGKFAFLSLDIPYLAETQALFLHALRT